MYVCTSWTLKKSIKFRHVVYILIQKKAAFHASLCCSLKYPENFMACMYVATGRVHFYASINCSVFPSNHLKLHNGLWYYNNHKLLLILMTDNINLYFFPFNRHNLFGWLPSLLSYRHPHENVQLHNGWHPNLDWWRVRDW